MPIQANRRIQNQIERIRNRKLYDHTSRDVLRLDLIGNPKCGKQADKATTQISVSKLGCSGVEVFT